MLQMKLCTPFVRLHLKRRTYVNVDIVKAKRMGVPLG